MTFEATMLHNLLSIFLLVSGGGSGVRDSSGGVSEGSGGDGWCLIQCLSNFFHS